MRIWIAGLIALNMVLGVQARTWTNADGKSVEAELVRVMDGKAYLRPAGTTKLYPFAMSSLSQSDRDFIDAEQKKAAEEKALKLRKSRRMKWHTDFNDALAEAEETGYPILFLYTAPVWCSYCRVLDNNVLEQAEFKEYARENLVYFVADFSDRDEGDQWKRDHADLLDKFPVKGFPRTYLVSPQGKKLGAIGGAETDWGPSDFIAKIEKHTK